MFLRGMFGEQEEPEAPSRKEATFAEVISLSSPPVGANKQQMSAPLGLVDVCDSLRTLALPDLESEVRRLEESLEYTNEAIEEQEQMLEAVKTAHKTRMNNLVAEARKRKKKRRSMEGVDDMVEDSIASLQDSEFSMQEPAAKSTKTLKERIETILSRPICYALEGTAANASSTGGNSSTRLQLDRPLYESLLRRVRGKEEEISRLQKLMHDSERLDLVISQVRRKGGGSSDYHRSMEPLQEEFKQLIETYETTVERLRKYPPAGVVESPEDA
ncbi:unnamed protein product [Amoebophrya sp. A25]|nr:unnamed protein product [Amoebophrya sp. A25]|eukprot:GSA25T00008968001.1